jgi:hypothetical protein
VTPRGEETPIVNGKMTPQSSVISQVMTIAVRAAPVAPATSPAIPASAKVAGLT